MNENWRESEDSGMLCGPSNVLLAITS